MSARKLALNLPLALALALVAACDDGGSSSPDAAKIPDAALPDGPVLPAGCDYAELADGNNDDLVGNGVAEGTLLTFSTSTTICGKLNDGHFDAQNMIVDIDSYSLNLNADATILVTLGGAGAEALQDVEVAVFNSMNEFVGAGLFQADHAVALVGLTAGTYTFTAFALNGTAITAPIDYKIKIVGDDPNTRCPAVTAAANFTEILDAAPNNNQNDMVDVRFVDMGTMNRVLTAGADTPEDTQITTALGTKVRLTGSHANVNAGDEYRDRDTYLITTGADTTQLTIRVDWVGATTDRDFMVFPEAMVPELAGGTGISDMAPELNTFAVKPNTRYWVWTATYDTLADGTTAPTLPSAYDVTICPENFVP